MFGEKKALKNAAAQVGKETVAQDLSDDFKRKISELHLQIRGGSLSPKELELAKEELQLLRFRLETRMIKVFRESTARLAH